MSDRCIEFEEERNLHKHFEMNFDQNISKPVLEAKIASTTKILR